MRRHIANDYNGDECSIRLGEQKECRFEELECLIEAIFISRVNKLRDAVCSLTELAAGRSMLAQFT